MHNDGGISYRMPDPHTQYRFGTQCERQDARRRKLALAHVAVKVCDLRGPAAQERNKGRLRAGTYYTSTTVCRGHTDNSHSEMHT
jgi:hypothetical protein